MSSAWPRCRMAALWWTSCLLAACGGGGDGGGGTSPALSGSATLEATFDVLVPASITAQWNGPAGSIPSCTLTSGSLPAGMTLSSACVLSGAPTETGSYTPRVTLTASGFTGSATVDGRLTVVAPVLGASNAPSGTGLMAGTAISGLQVVSVSYTAPYAERGGDVLSYRVASGALPAGLSLDPGTGTISGTPTQAETQRFDVGATLTRGSGNYVLAPFAVTLAIGAAPVDRHAEGAYFAEPASDPYAYRGVVLDDGTLWLAYGTLEPSSFGSQFGSLFKPEGFMTGQASPSGGTVPSFTLNDYANTPPSRITVSGSYERENSLYLVLSFGGTSGLPLSKPQTSAYDYAGTPATLGFFSARAISNSFDAFPITMDFAGDGTVSGLFNNNCSYSGTYAARNGKNVFAVQLAPFCFGGGTAPLTGVAFRHSFLFNGNTINQVVVMLTNAAGTSSLLITSQ